MNHNRVEASLATTHDLEPMSILEVDEPEDLFSHSSISSLQFGLDDPEEEPASPISLFIPVRNHQFAQPPPR